MNQVKFQTLSPEDQPRVEEFLLKKLSSSMHMLSNLRSYGIEEHDGRLEGLYVGAFQENEIIGVAAHFGRGNLLVQSEQTCIIPLLKVVLQKSGRKTNAILGEKKQVEEAKNMFKPSPSEIQLDSTEKLYALELDHLKIPAPLFSGKLKGRKAEINDLDLLIPWRVDYVIETLGGEDTPETREEAREETRKGLKEWIDAGQCWVLEKEGIPVSFTAFNAAVQEAVQIGGLWTPPQYRGHGYGRAAVAASLLDAKKEKVEKAILFTGDSNIPAQKAYESLGFQQVGNFGIIIYKIPQKLSQEET